MDELTRRVASDVSYFGESLEVEQAIVAALVRLPAEVREFALSDVNFCSVGMLGSGSVAQCLPPSDRWTVVVADDSGDEDVHGIVAHEVAHAWLNHRPGGTFADAIAE